MCLGVILLPTSGLTDRAIVPGLFLIAQTMKISQRAFDAIIAYEVSSKAYYERHLTTPEWPGGQSGVTVGIGYDLAYATPNKIRADWGSHVDGLMLLVMLRCSGVTGEAAKKMLPEVKGSIIIPWASALAVFSTRDVPQWTASVLQACPGADRLTPTCLGVLVSIAYNRGIAGFNSSGDRYTEMRAIRAHLNGMVPAIPGDIRSMTRLWPKVRGLRDRREAEAKMFQEGMTTLDITADVPSAPPLPDPTIPSKPGPARTLSPKTSTAQNTATGALLFAGGVATNYVHAAGYGTGTVVSIAALATAIAGAFFATWYQQRNNP